MSAGFHEIIDRRGTSCVKWDAKLPSGVELTPEQRARLIPMWVADMDFAVAPVIQEALLRRVEHGVFAYTCVQKSCYEAVWRWFKGRHGVAFDTSSMLYTTGVVPAISAVIKALVPAGEGVIIQTPVYNCFFSCVRNNGCEIVESPLLKVDLPDGRFGYKMDFDDLEAKCALPDTKMLLLCNPHNPAGKLWTAGDLRRVGEICRKHGVIVVSDEIHCEIVRPGLRYTPYTSVSDENFATGITLCSPSKGFNTAGLQMAFIITRNALWRELIDKALNVNEICDVNCFAPLAVEAAYTPEGAQWLDGMCRTVWDNYAYMAEAFARELPSLPVCDLEATYLSWVDISALGMASFEVEKALLQKEQVWVNAGAMYGCDSFIRINLAAPPTLAREGVDRIVRGLKGL